MEKSKAQQLAGTLRYLVDNDIAPGLLSRDVLAAADLLETQEKELTLADTALASKEHVVQVRATTKHYRTTLSADFIIADPRVYHGEIEIDSFMLTERPETDFLRHVSHSLARAGTDQWQRNIEEKTAVAFFHALRSMRTPEAA